MERRHSTCTPTDVKWRKWVKLRRENKLSNYEIEIT